MSQRAFRPARAVLDHGSPMLDVLILVYAGVGLVLGGAAASYEIWHRQGMLDRTGGRGKFPSPKMGLGELIVFVLFVVLFWPILLVLLIFDA